MLMTKDVIPGSQRKSYDDQREFLRRKGEEFEVPHLLDAATAILMHYVATGIRLYPNEPSTWTRCQERVRSWQVVCGGFASAGLSLDTLDYVDSRSVGVASLRKFIGH